MASDDWFVFQMYVFLSYVGKFSPANFAEHTIMKENYEKAESRSGKATTQNPYYLLRRQAEHVERNLAENP